MKDLLDTLVWVLFLAVQFYNVYLARRNYHLTQQYMALLEQQNIEEP